jgi:hypothetical protein
MEACDADLGASLFFAGSAELLVVSFAVLSALDVAVSTLEVDDLDASLFASVCFVSALTLLPFSLIATPL